MNGVGRGEDQEKRNKGALFTRETVGMTLLLFSAIIFFIAVTGELIFGEIGVAITGFFVGVFGYYVYPLLVLSMYYSAVLVFGKRWIPALWILRVYLLLVAVFLIVHTATAEPYYGQGYGAYLEGCWSAVISSGSVAAGTGGGVLFGLVVYPVRAALSPAGAYVVFALLTALALYFLLLGTPLKRVILPSARMRTEKTDKKARRGGPEAEAPQPVSFDDLSVPERAPALEEAARPSAPAPTPPPAPVDPRSEAYARSRAILFQGDPATSYRSNLIFDRDSRFNTYPRRSSVSPVEERPAAPDVPDVRSAPDASAARPASVPSYSERYLQQTESARPSMPRRVTEERPAPRAVSLDEDFNYPQAPSYRAPAESSREQEEHDYYSHDVPFEGLSSQPTVEDYEAPADPQSAPSAPAVNAAESVAPETPDASVSRAREREFRSIFSQPVEERTRIPDAAEPPAEERFARTPEPPVEDRFARTSEPLAEERFARTSEPPAEERFARTSEPPAEERTRISDDELSEADRFTRDPELPAESRVFGSPMRSSAADLFDGDDESDDADYREAFAADPPVPARVERPFERRSAEQPLRAQELVPAEEPEPAPVPQRHIYKAYVRPDIQNLDDHNDGVRISQEEIEQNSAIIIDTLAGFRVDAEVVKVTTGATVTRYDIDIPRNIAVRTVIKRDEEIAMRLHVRDGVNIYSNSEAGAISIEVPNSVRATVGLKSVMQSDEYVNAKPNSLMFAIGQDVEGRNVCGNIVKMTHILVAGSTNSGKSICLDSMLVSLICKYSPEELRLILIDPKKTEFIVFDGLPHLMINEIISDAQKAVMALNWAIKEMERRYTLFEKKTRGGINVRNIDDYNHARTEDEDRLPKIVIVVDELADLMSVAKKDIEERIQRLTQKARAAGIHLVIATQRPSVDVITGVIKGNLPTRMALRVIQEVDSRTILDESGAEKLLGNGDMLYRTGGMFGAMRVQGAFVSAEEMQRIVEDVKQHNEAYFDQSVAEYINKTESAGGGDSAEEADDGAPDPQYIKALAIVVKLGSASISLIQRKCSVGYNHAGKIIEWMEMMGYISAFDGKAKARTVLLTKEDFEAKYGDLD